MKRFFYFTFLLFMANNTFAQLTKGHWLVGGSGKFYSYKNEYSTSSFTSNGKYTQIDLSPNIGYFLADKFVLGVKSTISSIKGDFTATSGVGGTDNQRYLFGAFGRYYFLEEAKQTNILVDVSYQAGILRGLSKGNLSNFSVSAGPVIYFNPSVGIEFLLGYATDLENTENQVREQKNGFQFSIGLQIHLIK
jgi:hypothetical protein